MIAYKGFRKDLTCTFGRGVFQYRENEWIEEKEANCAKNGLHCSENILDCLSYYRNWEDSAFYEVEIEGDRDECGENGHISATRMKLSRKLNKWDFVIAALTYLVRHPESLKEMDYGWIRVRKDSGEAPEAGVVIVCGEQPKAAGPVGSILAFAKMEHGRIVGCCVQEVDGCDTKAHTWYEV